jgi:hypothetical protein
MPCAIYLEKAHMVEKIHHDFDEDDIEKVSLFQRTGPNLRRKNL